MEEKLEKIEIKSTLESEQGKEKQNNTQENEKIEENNDLEREELLKDIHSKGDEINQKSEIAKVKDVTEDKMVNNFVKEFYSIGIKAIEKAKKLLGAKGIDDLHDQITNKNKNSSK